MSRAGQDSRTVSVVCPRCGDLAVLISRNHFGIFEDLHIASCDVSGLQVVDGDIDDLLGLPPYDS